MNNITIPRIDAFSFYRSILKHPIIQDFQLLCQAYESASNLENFAKDNREIYFRLKSNMFSYSFHKNEEFHYSRTPWCDFIISEIISDENPLTLLFERGSVKTNHPFYSSMANEINIFKDLYFFDWNTFLKETKLDETNIFLSSIFFPLPPKDSIDLAFKSQDLSQIFSEINQYISINGLGMFENHIYFKVDSVNNHLIPV